MEKRKLTTILFVDIEGYTSLMQEDESTALGVLEQFEEILKVESINFRGTIIQYFGDGCLLSFDSALHGVQSAMAMQQTFMARKIPIRMGLHLGEVVFKGGNVFGDGVNIASRIESLGVAGAILLSSSIRDQIKNKAEIDLASLGTFEFKNIDEKIEVFAISNTDFIVPERKKMSGKLKEVNPSYRWTHFLIPIVSIVILGAAYFWYQSTLVATSQEKSIPRLAVLDFKNVGDPGDPDFANQLINELNSRLTGLQNLAVISRSSSGLYKKTTLNAQQIGKELNVEYVLEGTVRWTKEDDASLSMSIRPELVKVIDNTQLWFGQYDAPFSTSRNMHSEIAAELLDNLNIALNAEEKSMLQSSLTDNPLAYDAYMKGVKVKPPGHGAEKDFRTAFKMFQQAVNLDKDFTLAWVGLSKVYRDLYWYGYEAHPSTLDSAMSCLLKAKNLEPENPQVILGLGDHYYREREFDKSLAEFSKVMAKRPNDSEVLQYVGEVWRREGLFEQAIETLEKALQLDPFNVNSTTELAWTYIFVGDFDRAFELQNQARKYNPGAEWNYMMGAFIHWSRGQEGDLESARKLLANVPNPQSDYPAYFWVFQSILENDAESILRLAENLSVEAIELQSAYYPVELVTGLAHLNLGNIEQATVDLRQSSSNLEAKIEDNPSDFRLHVALGLSYAGLGSKEKAIEAAKRAINILPLEKDHLLGLDILYGAMRIYAILGENDLSMDIMSKLLSVPCQYRGLFFTANPEFGRFKNDQRFLDLLEKQRKMQEKYSITKGQNLRATDI